MDIRELGAIGELVGGVAVIGTLVDLAIQVRQSTRAQNAVAVDTAFDKIMIVNNAIAADGELCRIVWEGSIDWESFEAPEFFRFSLMMRNVFMPFDSIRLKREAGMVNDSLWYSCRAVLKRLITQRGVAQWWERTSGDFSPAFRLFVAEETRSEFEPLEPRAASEERP